MIKKSNKQQQQQENQTNKQTKTKTKPSRTKFYMIRFTGARDMPHEYLSSPNESNVNWPGS